MNKQEVLLEIKEFRKAFNKIKPKQFFFDKFVSKFNADKTCGTICCLWGWIPQIAPKIATRYGIFYKIHRMTHMSESPNVLSWPTDIRRYLFYPNIALMEFETLAAKEALRKVLKAWDEVIDALENTTKLDHLF